MAVAADGEVLEHDRGTIEGIDRAVAPADARRVLDGVDERQRDFAVEDRVADRIGGGADRDPCRRGGGATFVEPDDRDLGVAVVAAALDFVPVLLRGAEGRFARREAEDFAAVGEAHEHPPLRHARRLVFPDQGRRDDLGRKQRLIEWVGDRERARERFRERDRRGTRIAAGRHRGGERRQQRELPHHSLPARTTTREGSRHASLSSLGGALVCPAGPARIVVDRGPAGQSARRRETGNTGR